ncbi:hypothetical protein GUJ93_ZPchr0008g13023 [Zizania palustris]|uniref:Uncharacterized protein n=1 Tax=Zizania palustris TaxID=103762 RepID=A0A8J5V3E1_ZIZPA|nr:hypothetical protein GUJ93_ZPchr0008g13023 [Zizania palustris]
MQVPNFRYLHVHINVIMKSSSKQPAACCFDWTLAGRLEQEGLRNDGFQNLWRLANCQRHVASYCVVAITTLHPESEI